MPSILPMASVAGLLALGDYVSGIFRVKKTSVEGISVSGSSSRSHWLAGGGRTVSTARLSGSLCDEE